MTNNPKRRWRNQGIEYKPSKKNASRFWNAIEKYGWSNFSHEILMNDLSYTEACEKEKEFIALYNSTDENIGYNISTGGNGGKIYAIHPRGMLGRTQSDYEIEIHRKMLSNHKLNPMTNGTVVWDKTYPHPRGMKGKHQTVAHREAMKKKSGKYSATKKSFSIYKPDGTVQHFDTIKEFLDKYRLWQIYNILKGPQPYHVSKHNMPNRSKYEQFDGCIFKFDK